MGLCTPALIALVPGLFALLFLVIMAYVLGGLLVAAGALFVFGALFSIQPAILNEACKAGYANLAWMSVLATAVTSLVAAYATYHVVTAGREGVAVVSVFDVPLHDKEKFQVMTMLTDSRKRLFASTHSKAIPNNTVESQAGRKRIREEPYRGKRD